MNGSVLLCLVTGLVLMAGCGKSGGDGQASKAGPVAAQTPTAVQSPSTADTVINGLTGKTAVDAGKRAKKTIGDVNAKARDNAKDLDGE